MGILWAHTGAIGCIVLKQKQIRSHAFLSPSVQCMCMTDSDSIGKLGEYYQSAK